MNKRTTRYLFGFCMLWLAILSGCTRQDAEAKIPPRPVKVFRIQENTENIVTPFAGEARARWETVLSFRVAGKITHRSIEVGDHIRKGNC